MAIKNIEEFDFLDAPDGRYIRDGIKLLQQLDAVSDIMEITEIKVCLRPPIR